MVFPLNDIPLDHSTGPGYRLVVSADAQIPTLRIQRGRMWNSLWMFCTYDVDMMWI